MSASEQPQYNDRVQPGGEPVDRSYNRIRQFRIDLSKATDWESKAELVISALKKRGIYREDLIFRGFNGSPESIAQVKEKGCDYLHEDLANIQGILEDKGIDPCKGYSFGTPVQALGTDEGPLSYSEDVRNEYPALLVWRETSETGEPILRYFEAEDHTVVFMRPPQEAVVAIIYLNYNRPKKKPTRRD